MGVGLDFACGKNRDGEQLRDHSFGNGCNGGGGGENVGRCLARIGGWGATSVSTTATTARGCKTPVSGRGAVEEVVQWVWELEGDRCGE